MNLRTKLAVVAWTLAAVVATAASAAAQDSMGAARDLYASAAYDEALGMLNRLRASVRETDEKRTVDQYLAFCLLALGRTNDAEEAIQSIVAEAPAYSPSESDASPRVRSAFSNVRRRMLPAIIQAKYRAAKAAFDQKDSATAAAGFAEVVSVLGDPDIGAAANQPPLADLGTLAAGFLELSRNASAPPPVPARPPEPAARPEPPAALVYTARDAGVVPPAVVRQAIPRFSGRVMAEAKGSIEVLIDEAGKVEAASVREPVNPCLVEPAAGSGTCDRFVLTAAASWRYTPATVNGEPVKYRKVVQVNMKP
jgi:hypothetical protein